MLSSINHAKIEKMSKKVSKTFFGAISSKRDFWNNCMLLFLQPSTFIYNASGI